MGVNGPARGRTRTTRERRITTAIEDWFAISARDLPWREVGPTGKRDPYRSLVSEFMLQQTQVSRVTPAFARFLARFPTVRSLAKADPDEVIRHWEGLGYYRRARLLHRAAVAVVQDHSGKVPESVDALRAIPGIGPYTAGAVASIVFGHRTPIVDANVRRILLRIEGREVKESEARRSAWAWDRAGALVEASTDPGAFNEGLMELGAVVCLPRNPRCAQCPVAKECRARATSAQDRIPIVEPKPDRLPVIHQVVVIRDRAGAGWAGVVGGAGGRVLVEQRPTPGMWAGLWQFPTHETKPPGLTSRALSAAMGVTGLSPIGRFTRTTTHRLVEFHVWRATAAKKVITTGRKWVRPSNLGDVAFSVPHRLIASWVITGIAHPGWHPLGIGNGRFTGFVLVFPSHAAGTAPAAAAMIPGCSWYAARPADEADPTCAKRPRVHRVQASPGPAGSGIWMTTNDNR